MASRVILFSGGWESAYCALTCPIPFTLLFVDYGQAYAVAEKVRAQRFATVMDTAVHVYGQHRIPRVGRMFVGRNEALLRIACLYGDEIWFGCRGPRLLARFDSYGDRNRDFADQMERKLAVRIITPCVSLPKFYIKHRVRRLLAQRLVFSSEGL